MHIEDDIQIPLNSEAKIVSLDLMGTKGISLLLGDDTNDSYFRFRTKCYY